MYTDYSSQVTNEVRKMGSLNKEKMGQLLNNKNHKEKLMDKNTQGVMGQESV